MRKILIIFLSIFCVISVVESKPGDNLFNLGPNFDEKVTFSLYDKKEGNNSFDVLKIDDDDALKKSRFVSQRPTVFITHGFKASGNHPPVIMVRDAYLAKRDYNVIAINWDPLSNGFYPVARSMVSGVGKQIGKMINYLYKKGMNSETTTLVGHSLGAHIMGIAGQTASSKVNHTIGLDPAWPLFALVGKNEKLSDDDAHYVEVIHTNGGFLGTEAPIGHYDFYPNGGSLQNGCFEEGNVDCSHNRAFMYLAEQIKEDGPGFYAVKCPSYDIFKKNRCSKNTVTIMGGLDRIGAEKGKYYLNTAKTKPFGLGPII